MGDPRRRPIANGLVALFLLSPVVFLNAFLLYDPSSSMPLPFIPDFVVTHH
jgi:hypothetical protein